MRDEIRTDPVAYFAKLRQEFSERQRNLGRSYKINRAKVRLAERTVARRRRAKLNKMFR